ncbi:hypothetical protein C8R41DRAFT_435614 [Lentinula lateritia]|uniref:Uncharacterized protein n=1 Tax=Lentinula lateritia TaxID=40482 RepID=A0ABQ8VBH7_9AGAR|nr:hypothetical protein C8R41DRAFT_435614 [Lentinula lateritia]
MLLFSFARVLSMLFLSSILSVVTAIPMTLEAHTGQLERRISGFMPNCQPLSIQRSYRSKKRVGPGPLKADEVWRLQVGSRYVFDTYLSFIDDKVELIPRLIKNSGPRRLRFNRESKGYLRAHANFTDENSIATTLNEMSDSIGDVKTNLEALDSAVRFLLKKGLVWEKDANGNEKQLKDKLEKWSALYSEMKSLGVFPPANHLEIKVMRTENAWVMFFGESLALEAKMNSYKHVVEAAKVENPELLEGVWFPLNVVAKLKDPSTIQQMWTLKADTELDLIGQVLELLVREKALLDSRGKPYTTAAQINKEFIASVHNHEQKQKERAKGPGGAKGRQTEGS